MSIFFFHIEHLVSCTVKILHLNYKYVENTIVLFNICVDFFFREFHILMICALVRPASIQIFHVLNHAINVRILVPKIGVKHWSLIPFWMHVIQSIRIMGFTCVYFYWYSTSFRGSGLPSIFRRCHNPTAS